MQAEALCCTQGVALGQRAFNNCCGIGISLAYSPAAPSAAALARGGPGPPPPHALPPPPMLAVVLDASMEECQLQAALAALATALGQLNPQTRLLLLVVDKVVSLLDLKSPRPQAWVVHSAGAAAPAVLPQVVRAADIRATPLAHCQAYLGASLASLRHYGRPQALQHHLGIVAAACDIACFLLTASIAAWDAQHRPQAAAAAAAHDRQVPPPHNARVMVLTGLPNSACAGAAAAAQQLQHLEGAAAQQMQSLFSALAAKAASLDIPLDVITGSTAAPVALMLQEAVAASHGRLLHQPGLQPPLASNITALAQSRFGWDGVIDVRVPAGVKLLQLSGPIAPSQALPRAAQLSGGELPVTLLAQPGSAPGARAGADAAAAATAAAGGQPDGAAAGAVPAGGSPAKLPQGAAGAAAVAGGNGLPAAIVLTLGGGAGAGPMAWSSVAAAVPVLSTCSRFVASLELSRDWPPGSSFEVTVVCEWTASDGRRLRQVCSHTVQITDRLQPFIEGLDVPAVVLLVAQRLVATAAASGAPSVAASAGGLRIAAPPSKRALDEARLAVGMALSHVAQRLGHAHVSRRGVFGFGAQQVWQLPDDLIPLALSLYQLQRGPLLDPAAAAAADEPWTAAAQADGAPGSDGGSGGGGGSGPRSGSRPPGWPERGGAPGAAGAAGAAAAGPAQVMYGSWRVLVQEFMACSASAALRMVAPWLYVYDAGSQQFDVLPPLNLALEPDALAVLDCGNEVIIYVGKVLTAVVEGLPEAPAELPLVANGGAASLQRQQALGEQPDELAAAADAAAAAVTNGDPAAAAVVSPGPPPPQQPPQPPPVPDMAEAAAPAVRCAHQLVRGRVPVPGIRLVQDAAGMVRLIERLVPLHQDPVALQLLLLPHLRDLSPAQHGYLLEWHKHWSRLAAARASPRGDARAAGGPRLAAGEAASAAELSFGAWYSSHGVVLSA